MTEADWLACPDPGALLAYLRRSVGGGGHVCQRRLRLFACGCARRIWDLLPDGRSRRAVEAAERYADGLATRAGLAAAREAAQAAHWDALAAARGGSPSGPLTGSWVAYRVARSRAAEAARDAAQWCPSAVSGTPPAAVRGNPVYTAESRAGCHLLRCVLGPGPFRGVAPQRSWWTSTVVDLARGIYDERAHDRLPILADALQDGGCDSEPILAHCRSDGIHARGCWVVDLVLGKE
jgi:hypothetical protein